MYTHVHIWIYMSKHHVIEPLHKQLFTHSSLFFSKPDFGSFEVATHLSTHGRLRPQTQCHKLSPSHYHEWGCNRSPSRGGFLAVRVWNAACRSMFTYQTGSKLHGTHGKPTLPASVYSVIWHLFVASILATCLRIECIDPHLSIFGALIALHHFSLRIGYQYHSIQ